MTQADAGAFRYMWAIGERLATELRALFTGTGTRAIVQAVGPMLQIMFTDRPAIRDYREFCEHVDRKAYQRFALAMFEQGVYMSPSAALHSVATVRHSQEDVESTVRAARNVLGRG